MRYTILCAFAIILTLSAFSQPVINSFAPANGPVGTSITLKGTGFDTVITGNTVFFGAVKATSTAVTDTAIIVTVPSGATYQPITVSTNKGTGYSQNPFVVTFSGGGSAFGQGSFLPPLEFTTGAYPHAANLADFNGDGKPDLLVSRGSSATVSIFTNTSVNGVVSFSLPASITAAGNSHECAATGDLDGDGKLDFVTANTWNTSSISVFRNTSSGAAISFANGLDFPVVNGTYSVAIGDLDGDGKPDIAAANNGANQICVFRNTSTSGTISFAPRVDYDAGTSPYSVIIGDVDGDNKAELIYTTQSTGSALSVMKNKSVAGTLSFDIPIIVANFPGPFVATMGDLDGDNRPELVAASAGSGIVVKQNLSTPGNIAFSGQQYTLTTGNYPVGVVIADIDGDGKPDLASCNRMTNNISLIRNISTAGSLNFETTVDYNCGMDPFFLTAGDLNSDQRPEIIVANSSSTFVSVFTNIIGANIAPTINSFTPASGINGTSVTIKGTNLTGATAVSFGSVNVTSFTVVDDTTITAIVGQGASGDVNVTTSRGTASMPGFIFTGPLISSFTPKTGGQGTVVTINGSNFTNVSAVSFGGIAATSYTVNSTTSIAAVVGSGSSGDVSVTTPNGIATLAGFSYSPPTIINVNPLFAAVDSIITITGTNFSSTPGNNIVFFGAVKALVTGASSTELKVKVPASAAYELITVTVNRLTAYSPMPFNTTFATDSTTIKTNSFIKIGDFGTGQYPVSVRYCDFNDDGKPEMITANSLGNSVSILKNASTSGTVSFLNKIDLPAGLGPRNCVTGDLDGDGKPDLVAINLNSGLASTISVFRNTSSGGSVSFTPKTEYATGNGSVGLAIGDLNADGKPDLVTTSGNSGWFSIFLNTTVAAGAITFSPRTDIVNLRHSEFIVIADIDKDGRPDVVVSNFGFSNITVYRNLSNGGNFLLAGPVDISINGTSPTFMEAADVDGDGKLDIIVKSTYVVSIIKNYSTPGSISLQTVLDFGGDFTNPTVSDLNGDGKPDFTMGGYANGKIAVYENKYAVPGTPAFGDSIIFKVGNFDSFTGIGDLDGDGRPELSATNVLPNTVTVLSNKIGAPVIDSTSLSAAKGGDTVHISGSNLSGITAVNFGGTPAASFNQVSSTKVDAVVGGGASGNITVTSSLGTASFGGFSFIPVITASGPTTLCGDGTLTLTSSANAGNQWYRNNTLIAGATAKTHNPITSGNYTVKTTSNSITTSSSNNIDVTINTVPTPGISLNANSLVSSVANGNQWYLNNTLIQGATSQSYQPVQSGNYTVQATVNGCNSAMSTAFNFTIAGVINLDNGQFVKLYPNPVHDKLVINYVIGASSVIGLELYDINGKSVKIESNVRSGTEINLRQLSPGVYFLKLTSKNRNLGTIRIMRVE
jgi:hypothetical protein